MSEINFDQLNKELNKESQEAAARVRGYDPTPRYYAPRRGDRYAVGDRVKIIPASDYRTIRAKEKRARSRWSFGAVVVVVFALIVLYIIIAPILALVVGVG